MPTHGFARVFAPPAANLYADFATTWTTPLSILPTDIVHFRILAGGAGGCPYQGGGGSGGEVNLDFTNLSPGVVFHIQVGGAGKGSYAVRYGNTNGGHSWIKYDDPNTVGNPQYTYSANGGATDNAAGGGKGGQGCDPASGGCSLPRDQAPNGDPNLISQSFLPSGNGDGGSADANGNAMGSCGQNTRNGAGRFGAGGGAVGPSNAGDPAGQFGFDGYPGLVTVEIKP